MAIYLPFDFRLPYLSVPGLGMQPAIEVALYSATRATKVIGILDSGSAFTAFSEDVAARLGIANLAEGELVRASTLAGSMDLYLFNLEMSVDLAKMSKRFAAQVAFRHGHQSRNLLGRNLLFTHFQIGFDENQQEIYIKF